MCLSRAAGRLEPVGHRDARRARRRRLRDRSARPALPAARQQDVDLERRARADREHRPPGAGQDPRAPTASWSPGTRGISLFIVPKKLVDADGALTGERNDVALAGLNHKLGYRGITEHAAQFRRRQVPGARRRRARSAISSASRGEGLRCMFHMMNEARIAVGLGATMLGYRRLRGVARLREEPAAGPADRARRQGRGAAAGARSSSTPTSSACCWRRRAYCEGALALELYCARLVDEQHTGDADAAGEARAAARGADADRQELAERVVPRGQQPGDPGARRLRLHARLPGRAVLARQPPEHDPRGHARHPGARPARPQGA